MRESLEFFFETKNFGQFFAKKNTRENRYRYRYRYRCKKHLAFFLSFFLSFFREKKRARVVSFFLSFFLSFSRDRRRRRSSSSERKAKARVVGRGGAEAGKPCRNASVFLQLCSSSCVSTSSRRGTGTAVSLSGKSGLVAGTGPKTRRLQSLDDIRMVLPIDALCCNKEEEEEEEKEKAFVTIRGVFTYRKDKE